MKSDDEVSIVDSCDVSNSDVRPFPPRSSFADFSSVSQERLISEPLIPSTMKDFFENVAGLSSSALFPNSVFA